MWHEQLVPGSFNLPCLVRRYSGSLDVRQLAEAFAELGRRHEPLRTTFEVSAAGAHQVVAPEASPLAVIDLSDRPASERNEVVATLLADATGRPFDLASGPLFEPRLVRLGDDDHLLVVRLHHTAFDDWSVDVFRRELSALYGRAPLAPPPARFTDLAVRQQAQVRGGAGEADRAWWRHELEGAPLAVQLPIGGDGRDGGGAGDPVHVAFPAGLSACIRTAAPKLRATPFMTVLAAFAVLVGRHTGQDDLVLGSVTAHRNKTEMEGLIGCFTKKVPLRLRLDGDPTFAGLVARARASLLGALAHQETAFDAAVAAGLGRPAAEHGVVPQVSVVFQAETPQRERLQLPGITVGPYEAPASARRERHFSAGPDDQAVEAQWGDGAYLGTFLLLSLADTPAGMSLIARGVFDGPAVRELLAQFHDLLAALLADPDLPVAGLAERVPVTLPPAGLLDLGGFRVSRSRLEAALATCPGVVEVAATVRSEPDHEQRLVAYVVPRVPSAPPTLAELRAAQWAALPGTPWPSALVVVGGLPRRLDGTIDTAALPPPALGPPPLPGTGEPASTLLAAWAEHGGRAGLRDSYWQDFSFLPALAAARAAGFPITNTQVARNRTVEALVADITASGANGSPNR